MRRKAPLSNRAVHQITGWRRIAIGIAISLVSMTCLLPLSSQANAQVGRPTPAVRGVVAQPPPAPPDDTAQTEVRFRVVTPAGIVPPPAPPRTIASTGLNAPVAQLVGLALVLFALGSLFVGVTFIRRRARTRGTTDPTS